MTFNKPEPHFLSIKDIKVGQDYQEKIRITDDMVQTFISLTQDYAPVHVNHEHAIKMGFEQPVVHGLLVGSYYSKLLGIFLPGSNAIIHKILFEMLQPVFINDVLTYKVEVARIIPVVHSVIVDLSATNQNNQLVNRGSVTSVFRL